MAHRIVLVLTWIVFTAVGTRMGLAWNEVGHRRSVEKAIEALPKPVKDFYKQRRNRLLEQVQDPSLRAPRLVFEVDRLEPFPFEELPETREAAVAKYGEDKIGDVGDLPWRLVEAHQKLVEAFKEMDTEAIEAISAEVAYYVGEMYVPANLSRDGDGGPIGQEGLRERFDSRLLEMFGDKLKLDTPSARYLDRPAEYAVSIARKSYVWVDNLLLNDYIARLGVTSYDRFYYDGLWLRVSWLVKQLLEDSARDISSFWYTAWNLAGKPDLPKK
ncbi:MAG: hypothetical protein ACE5JI_02330 [Acidobacteriota bacterium]